jgi:hypothetical protein
MKEYDIDLLTMCREYTIYILNKAQFYTLSIRKIISYTNNSALLNDLFMITCRQEFFQNPIILRLVIDFNKKGTVFVTDSLENTKLE